MPNWKKVIVSGSDASLNSITTPAGTINNITASYAITASHALNGGVTQLLAGPNITLSPTTGKGQVTISSTGGGGPFFNTATGSYGSFYDTTTQTNLVANIPRSMSFNTTDITNGVSISGSTSPFNTYIKTENPGVYNIQFSAQVDKTDGGTDDIVIWLRKNGIDLIDTATTLTLPTNNSKVVAAWNWFVNSAANDYYQIIWLSADTDLRLLAETAGGGHPGIPSVILTANRVDQFLSNTGSFSGSFTGTFTGSLQGTASWATNALTASNISPAIANDADTRILTANGNGTLNGEANMTFDGTTLAVNQKLTVGTSHTNSGTLSSIAGGTGNIASGNCSFIGGGTLNTGSADFSTVGGGKANTASGYNSTISGGINNTASNYFSTVGGGKCNTASCNNSTVGGGNSNTASGYYSTVSGGTNNIASGYKSTVSGGTNNTASSFNSTVSGGTYNTASCNNSTVGGGFFNTASGYNSTISGGTNNTASGYKSTISGGTNNTASSSWSTVGGGSGNTASGYWSTVGGGYGNIASCTYSTVGGGGCNTASCTYSTVSGGYCNTASGYCSTVSGGYNNTASGARSTVGGGYCNCASDSYSTVGGGICNTASGYLSVVAGGYTNSAYGTHTGILGGCGNVASCACSFIVGHGITTQGTLNTFVNNITYYENNLDTANVAGEVVYFGGGTGLTAGNLVYLDSSGNWADADADATSTSTGLLGIALSTTGAAGVLVRGNARFTANSSYTGMTTVGAPLYVSVTAGAFSQTAPTAAGDIVRIIGYVTSTANDKMYFCPDTTWVEL